MPGKYTSSRQIRMSYSYSRRPALVQVNAAFCDLEQNGLGKYYLNLGFLKNPKPDVQNLSKYNLELTHYLEKYTLGHEKGVPYGLTWRQKEKLNALSLQNLFI